MLSKENKLIEIKKAKRVFCWGYSWRFGGIRESKWERLTLLKI